LLPACKINTARPVRRVHHVHSPVRGGALAAAAGGGVPAAARRLVPGLEDRVLPTPLSRSTPNDSVTLVFSDDPDVRWGEIQNLVDMTPPQPSPASLSSSAEQATNGVRACCRSVGTAEPARSSRVS
jgi:hypothetical protein